MTYKELSGKAKELAGLLKPGAKNCIPEAILNTAARSIDELINKLEWYLPPTAEVKKAAKDHPVSKEILALAKKNRDAFDKKYFSDEFGLLPPDKSVVAPTEPRTLDGLKTALLVYHYVLGQREGKDKLGEFLRALQEDDSGGVDIGLALKHLLSLRIVAYTTDSRRRKFFSVEYFRDKVRKLPPEKKKFVNESKLGSGDAARAALIAAYFYSAEEPNRDSSLRELLSELEKDFNGDPENIKVSHMKELYRETMSYSDPAAIASKLLREMPSEDQLREFSKINKLKMPRKRGSKKDGSDSRYLYEGIAAIIHEEGAITRLKLG